MEITQHFFVTHDGSRLHYLSGGVGTTALVFLHGNNSKSRYFEKQLAFFKENYRVIALDAREHGLSTNHRPELTFELMAQDLHLLLASLDITRFFLVGFSDGANLALVYSFHYPQKVAGLFLNAGNIVPDGLTWLGNLFTFFQVATARVLASFSTKWQRRLRIYRLMTQPFLSYQELSQIKVPALILVGQWDLIQINHGQKMADFLPYGELKILPKTFHGFAHSHPQRFNQLLTNFLQGVNYEKNN